jgi:CrcB protein
MAPVILVAVGGAIGSVLRYYVSLLALRIAGIAFPWGTLTVNVVGSFLIGVLTELIARRFDASMELRLLLVTGFLGGFTTFSAFSLDTIALVERDQLLLAIVYIVVSVAVSIAAVFGGLAAIRHLV